MTTQLGMFGDEDNKDVQSTVHKVKAGQLRLFQNKELAQFGVKANPKMNLSPGRLALQIQDVRTEEEKERELMQDAQALTVPLPDAAPQTAPQTKAATWRPTIFTPQTPRQQYKEAYRRVRCYRSRGYLEREYMGRKVYYDDCYKRLNATIVQKAFDSHSAYRYDTFTGWAVWNWSHMLSDYQQRGKPFQEGFAQRRKERAYIGIRRANSPLLKSKDRLPG